jgi:hypothetical protein
MIKGLMGQQGVVVDHGNNSLPYISTSSTNPIQGMIRLHGTDVQVYDGVAWINLPTSYATVKLDQDILDIIQWARTQRQLEQNRKTLINANPQLEKAYEAVVRAQANFDILSTFVEADTP